MENSEYEKALKWLEKQEAKGKNPIASIDRAEDKKEFTETYSVTENTPLCCPVCTHGFNKGTLWWNPAIPARFVCRGCKLTFSITLPGSSLVILISKIRGQKKAERELEKEKKKKVGK